MINTILWAVAISLSFVSRALAQTDAPLEIGAGKIELAFTPAPAEPLRQLVREWVRSSARAVTVYYGQFPVARNDAAPLAPIRKAIVVREK